MSVKRTTIIFVGGVALAAWLSAAMNPGRAPTVPDAIKPAPIDATGAVLSGEIARLRERLRPNVTPRETSRNPFVFRSKPRAASSAPGDAVKTTGTFAPAAGKDASIALVDRGWLGLSLAGVAEDPDPGSGAPVRTAIIAGKGQVFLAKEGDRVTDRGVEDVEYVIGKVFADSAELIDVRDGSIRRLTLK